MRYADLSDTIYGRVVHWPWTRLHVSGPMGSISDAYQSGQRSLLCEWWKNVFFYYINDIIGEKGSDALR